MAPAIAGVLRNARLAGVAGAIFLFHFLFVLLLQVEDAQLTSGVHAAQLVPLQSETVLVGIIFAAMYLVLRTIRYGKPAFYTIYFVALTAVAANQVFYKIFRDQFAFSFAEEITPGDIVDYWGSFKAELDWVQLVNFSILLLAIVAFVFVELRARRASRSHGSAETRLLAAMSVLALALMAVQAVFPSVAQARKIASYPLVAMWRGVLTPSGAPTPDITMTPDQFYRLEYGKPVDDSPNGTALLDDLRLLQQKRRNVIFVIIELVGSKQLLKDGKPNAEIAPFLASQAANAIIFDNLKTTFPASTRSHIALATGGATLTWGSVYSDLLHRYEGETIVSAFKSAGWTTGLFSAIGLNYENLNAFYFGLGYDHIMEPDSQPEAFREKYKTNGWGVDEKVVVDRATDWLKGADKPAFMHFLTVTTHHPYEVPPSFASPFSPDSLFNRYKTAVLYTDTMLKRLVDKLRAAGLADNTLLAIVGDHGEAFGKLHANDFTHKNYLYEENIRDYLMLVDLGKQIKPVYSRKRGFEGDVMPTILAAQGLKPAPDIIGQNLFSPDYKERMVFFHKNTTPEKWGLQDGNWKFIVERIGNADPELYDLNTDPDEQVNLASRYPSRVADYSERIANWFVYTNRMFVSRLEGYAGPTERGMTAAESMTPGPKHIAVGRKEKEMPFVPINGDVNPDEKLTVWTNGVAYPRDTRVDYVFTSPSGKTTSTWLEYSSDWSTVYLNDPTNQPREEGVWKVALYQAGKPLISTEFTVSRKARLYWSIADKHPGFRDMAFGVKSTDGTFRLLSQVNPDENVVAYTHGIPFGVDRRVLYTWTSPGGKRETFHFTVKGGWDAVWVYRGGEFPMEEGVWTVEASLDGKPMVTGHFEVSRRAELFQPIHLAASGAQ